LNVEADFANDTVPCCRLCFAPANGCGGFASPLAEGNSVEAINRLANSVNPSLAFSAPPVNSRAMLFDRVPSIRLAIGSCGIFGEKIPFGASSAPRTDSQIDISELCDATRLAWLPFMLGLTCDVARLEGGDC
jgi:hypothetical protein